ncbi:hypothetical protein, partial [Klebsiella pneumoniae]|uniref:hypothetical protein n=1 Tax=Klebsiella pneumoniae TaxID=573 RepID=UPI003D1D1243
SYQELVRTFPKEFSGCPSGAPCTPVRSAVQSQACPNFVSGLASDDMITPRYAPIRIVCFFGKRFISD